MWRVCRRVAVAFFVTVACGGEANSKNVGKACITADESNPTFAGFAESEVSVEASGRDCGAGVCLVNHFKGRVSCPYGQSDLELEDPRCLLPGTSDPVLVPVPPQDSVRTAALAVTCSCRCAGPGAGPFCSCPIGAECAPVVENLGLPGSEEVAGSYCIPEGARFTGREGPECSAVIQNCGPP